MKDEGPVANFFGEDCPPDKVHCEVFRFLLPDLPAHDLMAEDVEDEVQIVIEASYRTRDPGNVP